MKTKGILALIALFSLPLYAAEKPTSDEVRKVMDYYKEGGEAILVESRLCVDIEKSGDDKNECTETLPDGPLQMGQNAYLWMNYLVPGSDPATLLVQFKYKGRALNSDEIRLSNAIRYRTWKTLQTSKSGEWEVNIEQETESGYTPVGTISYIVAEPAADETPAQ